MFTIDYIAKNMGLTVAFIRKCLKQLDLILKPHYIRGDSNQIMFTENGYAILDQIKQLKEKGLNINAIKAHLEQQLNSDSQQVDKAIQDDIVNPLLTDINLLKRLFKEKELRLTERLEHQQRIFELEHLSQHQQRITELERLSDHLKGQLLYLTDGKTPEEVKQHWQQSEMDKQRISWLLKEIESLEGIFSVVNYFKRKKLYKELQGLMTKQTNPSSNDVSDAT
jgi:DNA-binding transcriptional MerR regulator